MNSNSIQAIVQRDVLKYYADNGGDLGCVRSGLSDAAHMIDAIGKDITSECCPGGRRPRKEIQMVLRCLERAAQAVWNLRDEIKPNQPRESDDQ